MPHNIYYVLKHTDTQYKCINDYVLLDTLFDRKSNNCFIFKNGKQTRPVFDYFANQNDPGRFQSNTFDCKTKLNEFIRSKAHAKNLIEGMKENIWHAIKKDAINIEFQNMEINFRNIKSAERTSAILVSSYKRELITEEGTQKAIITKYLISNISFIITEQYDMRDRRVAIRNIDKPLVVAAFVYPIEYAEYLRMCLFMDEEPKANLIQLWVLDDLKEAEKEMRVSHLWVRRKYIFSAIKEGIPIIKKSKNEMENLIFSKQGIQKQYIKNNKKQLFPLFKEYLQTADIS